MWYWNHHLDCVDNIFAQIEASSTIMIEINVVESGDYFHLEKVVVIFKHL